MSSVKVPGKIIQSGYGWTARLAIGDGTVLFPAGAKFRAQVRRAPDIQEILFEMTSDNGGITRVDGNKIDLSIPGTATASWPTNRKVYIDVVRTDVTPPQHLGFRLTVPVQLPITR